MTMAEKILAAHVVGAPAAGLREARRRGLRARGRRLLARVHHRAGALLPGAGVRARTTGWPTPRKFAVFEDHLIYADGVPKMAPFSPKIEVLRELQRDFQRHTGVQDYSAQDGVSPGICHSVAREKIIEPGDFIQATDSHTCMGGALDALAYGVGATEYAALVLLGLHVRGGAGVDPLRAGRARCRRASRPRT